MLSHYHAVRVLGASAYDAEHIIASRGTYELIQERGALDYKSEAERFPRLFQGIESIPGLTWPSLVFDKRMTLWLGDRQGRDCSPRTWPYQGRYCCLVYLKRKLCSAAIWSNTVLRLIPAMPI